jgi:hypothetical protein
MILSTDPQMARTSAAVAHDHFTVMMLAGMLRFPTARATALRLGPDIFPEGVVRHLAQALALETDPRPFGLTPRQQRELASLRAEVARCELPDTEPWAARLVCNQAERHLDVLLITELEWAIQQIRGGARVSWVRNRVLHAFAVTEGDGPLDPNHEWGVGHAR